MSFDPPELSDTDLVRREEFERLAQRADAYFTEVSTMCRQNEELIGLSNDLMAGFHNHRKTDAYAGNGSS